MSNYPCWWLQLYYRYLDCSCYLVLKIFRLFVGELFTDIPINVVFSDSNEIPLSIVPKACCDQLIFD